MTAKEANVPQSTGEQGRFETLNGQRLNISGVGRVHYEVADSLGNWRGCVDNAQIGDIHGFDMILGMPWLERWNPAVDFAQKSVTWRRRGARRWRRIATVGPEGFVKETRDPDAHLFALSVKEMGGPLEEKGVVLPPEFERWKWVFSAEDAATLPEHGPHELAIDLVEGQQPPWGPIYPLSAVELTTLRQHLDKELATGWIRPSRSPAGAPILFAKKKDGSLRLCIDYRGLNAITIKNRYPLPLIQESLDRLAQAKHFTKLDLRDAYHRIRIKEGDEWKTAFRTRYGHFEYTVVPFGLSNAPGTFQAYVNSALSDLLDTSCIVFMDDILVFSQTREDHCQHVQQVLDRLGERKLYCKLSKCEFFKDQVCFLGFVVGPEGVSMEPERVRAIQEWPLPQSIHDVRVFIGFANYYRRFIRRFSGLAAALNKVTEGAKAKDRKQKTEERKPLQLSPGAVRSFESLKEAFCQAPVLRHFDPEKPSRLETDASGEAISGILHQLHEHEGKLQWHPVAFYSRKLIAAERHYETYDGELLAIVESCKHFRHYVEGAQHQLEVISDHNNLQWFMTTKQLTRRQARWAEWLSGIDFKVTYRPGRENDAADALSRRPDYCNNDHSGRWGTEEESSPVLRILQQAIGGNAGPHQFAGAGWQEDQSDAEGLERRVQYFYQNDPVLKKVQEAKEKPITPKWALDWRLEEAVWRRQGRLYIPEGPLRLEVMKTCHDDPLSGHFGFDRTLELVKRAHFWPKMRQYVKDYTRSCQACERSKPRRHLPYGLLGAEAPSSAPWEDITLDFITDLPPSRLMGQVYDSILVVVDRFTKMAHYVPCRKEIQAEGLADALLREVVRLHGVPKSIVSDRGPILTSKFWSSFCYYLGIRRGLSTAYHPQTDGQTERQNQTLEQYLRIYCNYEQDDWARLLSLAEFAYNDSEHAVTGASPFQLNYVRDPQRIAWPERAQEGNAPRAEAQAERMLNLQRELRDRLEKAKADQARYYNRGHKDLSLAIGDMVYLSTQYLDTVRPSAKLDYKYIGPFPVEQVINKQAYKLKLPQNMTIHPVFHVSLLEPANLAQETTREQPDAFRFDATAPDVYEVQEVVEQETTDEGKWLYKVRWKGYGPEEDTWEPAEHLSEAAIRAYQRKAQNRAKELQTAPGRAARGQDNTEGRRQDGLAPGGRRGRPPKRYKGKRK
jgi:transposase InsO family protein